MLNLSGIQLCVTKVKKENHIKLNIFVWLILSAAIKPLLLCYIILSAVKNEKKEKKWRKVFLMFSVW